MKRILSLLLVMLIVFSAMLPVSAFAASDTAADTIPYGDSGTMETQLADEDTETPDDSGIMEIPFIVEDAATTSDAALTVTPTEPSKLLASPDEQAGTAFSVNIMLAATQSERNPNPHIVYTYSPAILNGAGPIIFTDSTTGMPAYCIDYNRNVPSPESLDGDNDFDPETIFDPATYEGLKCLLLAGYPYETGNGLTAAEAQGCTQLAIWCWTYETMGYGLNAASYTAIPGKEYIYDYFIGLMEAARNQTWPELELSATDVYMIKNGDVLTGQTTVHFHNLEGGYTLDESKLPEGIIVSGYTGNNGDVLTFTAPLSFAGQSLVLEDILAGHDERSELNLFWYDNKNPNQQRMAISVTDTATIAISAGITMNFQGVGTIKLKKVSDSGNIPLSGAVFGVFDAETDEQVAELTTDENGEASVTLAYGNFYLRELSAPAGFRLNDAQYPVQLDEPEIEVTATNVQTGGGFKLFKTDENGGGLENAVFGVYRASDNEKIGELTTNAEGYAEMALPVGDFYLLELTAPEGFQKSDEEIPFNIIDNEITERTVTNTRLPELPKNGYLQLIKIEQGKANIFLSGAVFGVYNVDTDEKICELTTGADGKASTELPEGEFYLLEQSAPAGYRLVADKTSFTIKPTEITTITVENPKLPEKPKNGEVKVIKRAEGTGKYLAGAVFGIYNAADNTKVAELKTGADGTASAALSVCDYYLLELKAPANFQLSSDKIFFSVKENETREIVVTNKPVKPIEPESPKPGTLTVIKKAENTSKYLKDAVFGVYEAATDKKVAELKTGSEGKATAELSEGHFYLRELKAPANYELSRERISFSIKSGEAKTITVTNKPVEPESPKPGTLTIVKKAENTNKYLKDAVFGVYDAATDKKVAEVKTGSEGKATVELSEGDFYLRELKAPANYELSREKISFSIKSGEAKTITVTNKPIKTETPAETGTLQLIKKAESTGERLAGAVFGVYEAATDKKVAELKTGSSGMAAVELELGKFYLRELKAPAGFQQETAKISFSIDKAGVTVKVEMMNKREVVDEPVTIDDGKTPQSIITVPKTGETPPYVNYAIAALCMGIAGVCGIVLYRGRKKRGTV